MFSCKVAAYFQNFPKNTSGRLLLESCYMKIYYRIFNKKIQNICTILLSKIYCYKHIITKVFIYYYSRCSINGQYNNRQSPFQSLSFDSNKIDFRYLNSLVSVLKICWKFFHLATFWWCLKWQTDSIMLNERDTIPLAYVKDETQYQIFKTQYSIPYLSKILMKFQFQYILL